MGYATDIISRRRLDRVQMMSFSLLLAIFVELDKSQNNIAGIIGQSCPVENKLAWHAGPQQRLHLYLRPGVILF